jgi:hypothetical protein
VAEMTETDFRLKEGFTMMVKLIVVLLTCCFGTVGTARAQTLDQEMSGLADKINKALVAKGCKNVAAIDFTDLQGQPTELGRYLSERLAVEIVSTAGVSMVDRANIKSILAEHKLTEEGLVNPANAKKLGEFAGVDAILIGNVTTLDDGVELMVKGISTASAQIIAAGRIKFPKTSEIQQLFNRSVSGSAGVSSPASATSGDRGGNSYQDANAIATKDIGSLRVVLKSLLPMKGQGRNLNGIRMSFEFTNRETQRPIAVALNSTAVDGVFHSNEVLRATVLSDRGAVWRLVAANVAGIGVVGVGREGANRYNKGLYNPTGIAGLLKRQDDLGSNTDTDKSDPGHPYQFVFGSMTPILPGQSVRVTMDYTQENDATASGPPSKFVQIDLEIVVGVGVTASEKSYSLQNLTFDRVTMPVF